MTDFKVLDAFSSHPATVKASLAALGLWTVAGSWCARHNTNGHVLRGALPMFGGSEALAQELVKAGLWRNVKNGYRFVTEVPAAKGCLPLPICSWDRNESRRPIPAATRALIYERDEFRCVECGSTSDLTLDHIFPWSKGGSDALDNLRTLCRTCNASKGAKV